MLTTHAEINDILQGEDIVRFCKGQRIRWIGHVERMAEHRVPKKIYRARMEGRRIQGRPRNRWKDEVEADLRRMGVELVTEPLGETRCERSKPTSGCRAG